MPLFTFPSLKEICLLAVIKEGIERIDLPSTLADEVEELEENIKSIFTGTFQRPHNNTVVTLTIGWTQGQWELTLNNHKTLVVKFGVENTLGRIGGELFLLPGRRSVTIFDYKLDLERKKLSFVGKCASSTKRVSGRCVEIVLHFDNYPEMMVETYRECKVRCCQLCSYCYKMKIFLKDSHYDPQFF